MFTLFDPEDSAQIYRKPGSQVTGEIVYVGRACPTDQLLADPNGKIAFRDQSIVASRQVGAGNCTIAEASKKLEEAGAKGTVVGAIQNATGTARVQTFSADGDEPAGGLTTPTMGLDTVPTIELRDALCPAPATPGTGCGPGGQSQTGAMVDTKGDWGALRVVDVSDPAGPTLRGTYRTPGSQVFPPPDRGVRSVHHAVASGSKGYVAAHADGLRVIDLSSPNPVETASFVPPDTVDPTGSIPPKAHVTGVGGKESDTIVISDMNSGLYVLRAAAARGPVSPPRPSQPPGGGSPSATFAGCPALTANVIRGSAAANTITGTTRADRIFAGAGNDIVDALSGNDCVDLGTGDDRGQGGIGADLVVAGAGRDRVSGSSGNDRLNGNAGNDRLNGGSGNDRLNGGSGNDSLLGSFGNDILSGSGGEDSISGSRGRDRINGGSGNDKISAGSSNDRVAGGSGSDRINGNSGSDRISGNSGNDRITSLDNSRDRVNCGSGRDSVVADRKDIVSRNCERVRRR